VVDAVAHADVAKQFGVAGYPTLRYFKENEVQVMDGASAGRTSDEVRHPHSTMGSWVSLGVAVSFTIALRALPFPSDGRVGHEDGPGSRPHRPPGDR
jgi:hypothetical protein